MFEKSQFLTLLKPHLQPHNGVKTKKSSLRDIQSATDDKRETGDMRGVQ